MVGRLCTKYSRPPPDNPLLCIHRKRNRHGTDRTEIRDIPRGGETIVAGGCRFAGQLRAGVGVGMRRRIPRHVLARGVRIGHTTVQTLPAQPDGGLPAGRMRCRRTLGAGRADARTVQRLAGREHIHRAETDDGGARAGGMVGRESTPLGRKVCPRSHGTCGGPARQVVLPGGSQGHDARQGRRPFARVARQRRLSLPEARRRRDAGGRHGRRRGMGAEEYRPINTKTI